MEWLNRIKQWGREQAAELAKDHPETAEMLARWTQGDAAIDMVKFLYEEEPGLDKKIAEARKDPMFDKIYATVLESSKAQIMEQINTKLPPDWEAAATSANIPVDTLKARMEKNGAEKIAFAIASSVREEVESMAWYSGKIAGDTFREAKDAVWKTPEENFQENPLAWILTWVSTMVSNVVNLVSELFSTKRADLEQRGMQYVASDTAARAEEIVTKMGTMLHVERKMPATFTADTMVAVYEQLKTQADPKFRLADDEKARLKTQFMTQLQSAAAAVAPPQPQPQQQPAQPQQQSAQQPQPKEQPALQPKQEQPGYSGGDELGLPGIASDAEAKAAAKPEGPHSMAARFMRGEGEYAAAYPDLPELSELNADALRKLGIDPYSTAGVIAAKFLIDSTEEGRQKIIKQYIPDATFIDDNGSTIVVAGDTRFYLNRPGASMQDINEVGRLAATVAGAVKGFLVARGLAARAGLTGLGATVAESTLLGTQMAGMETLSQLIHDNDDLQLGDIFISFAQTAGISLVAGGAAKPIWGAIVRKISTGKALTVAEAEAIKQSGTTISEVRSTIVNLAEERAKRATAAAGVAGTAAVTTTKAMADEDNAIPCAEIDPACQLKPGKTPGQQPSGHGTSESPLMP